MAAEYSLNTDDDLECFSCGCKQIETRVIFDHFCSGGKTVDCRCTNCEAQWLDDTLGVE